MRGRRHGRQHRGRRERGGQRLDRAECRDRCGRRDRRALLDRSQFASSRRALDSVDDCRLQAGVTIGHHVRIGARCVFKPGCVVGSDGFGFAPAPDGFVKVPHLGGLRIGDDVEVGSNTTIDRGTIEDTVIDDGVKLDNQVQVGHNCRIGAHTVIAGCAGISGSTIIGRRCMIGGAVGVVGHLEIGDDVVVTGYSMVTHSLPGPGTYSSGMPAIQSIDWRRTVARLRRLDALERRLARLERGGDGPDQETDE